MGTVVALRRVRAGEELCISYCDVHQPRDVRRATLRHYGFECACVRCARGDSDEEELEGAAATGAVAAAAAMSQ